MIKQLTILFMLFSLFSCEKEHLGDCFNSTGSKKISYRDVALFSQIELDDRIDLDLIWDTSLSEVSVEAGNGIIDNIITEVKDGELKIYNTNKCNWVRSFKKQIKVTVRGSSWNKITYRGSGTIQSKNQISADLFFLDCWEASGDIYLNLKSNESYLKSHTGPTVVNVTGESAYSYLFLAGNGEIKAENYHAVRSDAINKNQGKVFIKTSNSLNATIEGNGSIYEFGNPTSVNLNRTGNGDLFIR